MTFCTFSRDCAGGKCCRRALTDGVIRTAAEYEMMVETTTERPDCYHEFEIELPDGDAVEPSAQEIIFTPDGWDI